MAAAAGVTAHSTSSCGRLSVARCALLVALAAWSCLLHNTCRVSATELPSQMHAAARVRTATHLDATERLRRHVPQRASIHAPGAGGAPMHGHARSTLQRVTTGDPPPSLGNTGRNSPSASSGGAPIRILPELQLPSSISAANRTKATRAMTAAILTLQTYIQVRRPVGPTGLLVAPQYYDESVCASAPQQSSGQLTCAGPGFFPTFNTSIPQSDILAPYCGAARINPSHVMDARTCAVQSGPATGVVDPSCTTSAAGTRGGAVTDVYLYVTSDPSNCGTNVLAYASTCLYDLVTNRPVMSYFNVCPLALSALTPQQLVNTMVHELMHALGFSPDMWNPTGTTNGPSFFISDSGASLPASRVVATLSADPARAPGTRVAVPMVVTPTVVREVRSHFGCPTLPGAALEDQGGAGSAGSHWEFDLFQGDIMTSQAAADADWQRLSRLTLALMQDSGWYWGNWSQAPPLEWGRSAGCSLPQLTCARYMVAVPQQPYFCDATQGGTGCTYNGRSWGPCHQDSQFSRCGIITTAASGRVVEPACISTAYARFGLVGPSARCVPGLTGPTLSAAQWPCRQASCTSSTASGGSTGSGDNSTGTAAAASEAVTYIDNGSPLVCSSGGGSGLGSSAGCPANVSEVCDTLQCPSGGCSATGGDCFDGVCVCRLGFAGPSCASSLLDGLLPDLPAGFTLAPPPPPLRGDLGARPLGLVAVWAGALLAAVLPILLMAPGL